MQQMAVQDDVTRNGPLAMRLRVVVVEDEALARERLCKFLGSESDVEIVGICEDGQHALRVVQSRSPDVVFLDVQMPEMDGFGFLQALPPTSCPVVIIVTGDGKHALKAFDIHAVDFLLKPFGRERFRLTLQRARERIHNSDRFETDEVAKGLRQVLDRTRSLPEWIAIKNNRRVVFVTPADIDWIDAAGNYCEIHAGRESHMLLSTLSALEDRL